MDDESIVPIGSEADIVHARQRGRTMASALGFTPIDLTLLATAISEVARNMLTYAVGGEIVLRSATRGGRPGITVVARDAGPGIADVERALQDGYSTGNGLGIGLPGARRIMDEFHIVSEPGIGTTITMTKWALGR